MDMTELSAQTPVEIDTELAKLYYEQAKAQVQMDQYAELALRKRQGEKHDSAREYEAKAQQLAGALNALEEIIRPLEAEYARRPWTRFWLVTNSNGHVHHTTHCDTCFANTSFAWLTQCSGLSNDELVELAGEKACTVCFPNAPVDVLKRASKLTTPEQEARRREKAAKALAASESQVVVENYTDGGFRRPSTHVFKTVRGATNAIASTLGSLTWYGPGHPSALAWVNDVKEIRKALDEKGVEYDYDKALANARKKTLKDGGEVKF